MSHYDLWKNSPLYRGHMDQWFGPHTYSCCGQDLLVTQLFWLMGNKKPSYLDIGAHHPFNISNTALLYSRGSRGVNVEANPKLMEEFHLHRPEDKNVNIGVSPNGGPLTFYQWDDRSGRNTFSKEASEEMDVLTNTTELETDTLNHIVDQHCDGQFPDFLSMDIEGMDFPVLEGADFSKSSPKVVCVESSPKDVTKFVSMMGQKGFIPVCRLSVDIIFLKRIYSGICQIP